MRTVAAALFVALIAFVSGCGGDDFSSNGNTIVQEPPPAPSTVAPLPPFTAPAGLKEAMALDDGNTLAIISCSETPSDTAATAYELSLEADELFEVGFDRAGTVVYVSYLASSPDLQSASAAGKVQGTIATGTAQMPPDDLAWNRLAFAFDSDDCT